VDPVGEDEHQEQVGIQKRAVRSKKGAIGSISREFIAPFYFSFLIFLLQSIATAPLPFCDKTIRHLSLIEKEIKTFFTLLRIYRWTAS
jgi:hypothetical protein